MHMRFRKFILKEEAMGAPPMGGMAAPPMGGSPMGGMAPPMGGGMGGDPLGGGMGAAPGAPPMGGMPQSEPPVIPKHADVWDVLDAILNHKHLGHEKQLQNQKQNPPTPPQNAPPAPPMGGMPATPDMSGGGMPMGGAPAGGPALTG